VAVGRTATAKTTVWRGGDGRERGYGRPAGVPRKRPGPGTGHLSDRRQRAKRVEANVLADERRRGEPLASTAPSKCNSARPLMTQCVRWCRSSRLRLNAGDLRRRRGIRISRRRIRDRVRPRRRAAQERAPAALAIPRGCAPIDFSASSAASPLTRAASRHSATRTTSFIDRMPTRWRS